MWGAGIARRHPTPSVRSVLGSFLFHGLLAAALLISNLISPRDLPQFEVYRVQLVSPPPQVEGPPTPVVAAAPVVERPEPERVVEAPKPGPEPQPRRPVERKPAPERTTRAPEPSRGANPKPDSPGGEGLNINLEGREFPYPEYLENIVLQLTRYFRWEGSPNLKGTVAFYISRDGSVGGITVAERSGDFNFDLEMMSSVEQAGRRGAFGPLPAGWVPDRLWVRFLFLPPSG